MFENTVTLMKYKLHGNYQFHVLDKFVEPDEAKRLDLMMIFSDMLQQQHGEDYEQLWIKNTPII